jgi:hypothetical protein
MQKPSKASESKVWKTILLCLNLSQNSNEAFLCKFDADFSFKEKRCSVSKKKASPRAKLKNKRNAVNAAGGFKVMRLCCIGFAAKHELSCNLQNLLLCCVLAS